MIVAIALAAVPLGGPQASAERDDQALPSLRCDECHRSQSYAHKTHTRLAWYLIVLRMEHFHGARLQPGDRDRIVDHLATARPAPLWRMILEWSLLVAIPAMVVSWFLRLRRLSSRRTRAVVAHELKTGEERHG